jgi:hypothetical protein
MSYTSVFGGNTIYPSDVSYLALALDADVELAWPLEAAVGNDVVARIIDVTPSGAYSIIMPPADQTGTGQTVLFNNLGPSTITVKDNAGATLVSIAQGLQYQLYLTSNTTVAGTWRTYQMGASTAQAQASALAGFGLLATGSTLSTQTPISSFNSNFTLGSANRAATYVWTGALGTLTLPAAATLANGWFVNVRNNGTGDLTVDPAGSETINDLSTLTLSLEDSCTIVTDGITWYTVGFGQNATFAFDYTSIDLTGQTSPYTLAGAELNRIAYTFVGTLTANMDIVVPNTTQQYWITNDTTGAYTFRVRTSTQVTGVEVGTNEAAILYSDGTNVVAASTGGVSFPISVAQGGTGATTAASARVNLGGTSTGISLFTATSAASARTTLGSTATGDALFTAANAAAGRSTLSAAASGANSDITSLTGLTTPLSVAQGGTGAATITGLVKGAGTSAFTAATVGTDYVAPATATTFTATQTFTGSTSVPAEIVRNIAEPVTVSATAATGTIAIYPSTQSVLYYTTNASANWTVNLTWAAGTTMNTALSTGQAVTVAFMVTNGGTAYYNSSVQVDGTTSGVTTKWQGGLAPSAGNVNSIDVYTYTIIKTGSATFTVLASVAQFA